MSRIKKIMTLMFISIVISVISYGQDAETNRMKLQADSLQRIKMKDSLGISDETVTAIFATRDSLMNKVVQLGTSEALDATVRATEIADARELASAISVALTVASSASLDATVRATEIADARELANEKIKEILGETTYKKYLQMIRSRLEQRQSASPLPLAGETESN